VLLPPAPSLLQDPFFTHKRVHPDRIPMNDLRKRFIDETLFQTKWTAAGHFYQPAYANLWSSIPTWVIFIRWWASLAQCYIIAVSYSSSTPSSHNYKADRDDTDVLTGSWQGNLGWVLNPETPWLSPIVLYMLGCFIYWVEFWCLTRYHILWLPFSESGCIF
jgi:hypothetical protein